VFNRALVDSLYETATLPFDDRLPDYPGLWRLRRDSNLGALLHLLRERKVGRQTDVDRAWFLLTFVLTMATLIATGVISYLILWAAHAETSVVPENISLGLANELKHIPIFGIVVFCVTFGLLIVLSALTFGRLRATIEIETEEQFVNTYSNLLAVNERLGSRRLGYK
jgi:hypothetical protein